MKMKSRISAPVEDELKARLSAVGHQSGIGEANIVRAACAAVCNYWDMKQELTMPFMVIPENLFNELMALKE